MSNEIGMSCSGRMNWLRNEGGFQLFQCGRCATILPKINNASFSTLHYVDVSNRQLQNAPESSAEVAQLLVPAESEQSVVSDTPAQDMGRRKGKRNA